MRKRLTYGDLPEAPEYGVVMRCEPCGESWSAWRGDYFMRDDGERCECGLCGEPLKLVRKVVRYVEARA